MKTDEGFLYKYERPSITADIMLVVPGRPAEICLIERGGPPFEGHKALIGGFGNPGERIIETAVRETSEEITLDLTADQLSFFGYFDTPGRDPRGWVVSFAFLCYLKKKPKLRAADDAKSLAWYPLHDLPDDLAFDHNEIIQTGITWLGA